MGEPSQNMWVQLAQRANLSSFCLKYSPHSHDILESCLIPVCKSPDKVISQTPALQPVVSQASYETFVHWRPASKKLPLGAASFYTPNVANHPSTTCAQVTGCKKDCLPTGSAKWACNFPVSISYVWAHIALPLGWFWTCYQHTFSYIPANLSDTQCCLSRLTIVLPDKRDLESQHRIRRSEAIPLDSSCDSSVHLLSKSEYVALGIAIIGVPGLAVGTAKTVSKLACALAKSINATSTTLAKLNMEQQEHRRAILQNRAALDYLLMLRNLGCHKYQGMCCFNLSDNSNSVNHQIARLNKLAANIKEGIAPSWWNDIWSWLPS